MTCQLLSFQEIKQLHQLYNELTGLFVPWTMERLWPWERFSMNFTSDDLKLVIKFIQRKQRAKKPCRSLTFRNFISGPCSIEWFGEDLAEARSELLIQGKVKAQQGNVARNQALLSINRPTPIPDRVRSAEQILAGDRALQELLKVRDNL